MENESRFRAWLNSVSDFFNEQQWYQELKTKWEELDPQSRIYLKFAAAGCGALIFVLFLLSAIWSVHSLKSELYEKRALLTYIQSSSEELKKLRNLVPPGAANQEGAPNWSPYFESLATNAGMEKSSLTVSPEKPGATTDQSQETIFELGLKHVNIKQIVRYAFSLETGQKPVKLRNLVIDSKAETTGYLDATLSVSAFKLVTTK